MKKNVITILMTLFCCFLMTTTTAFSQCSDCGKLVITSAIEPPDVNAAAIQVCAIDDIADLSIYSLTTEGSSAPSNDDLSQGEFNFPADALAGGSCVWIGILDADFSAYFGFSADYYDADNPIVAQPFTSNNVYLTCLGNIDDQYGDGTSTSSSDPETFNDGWFIRNAGVCPNGGMFSVGDFTVSGNDATDGSNTAAEAGYTPLTSYTTIACDNIQLCGGVSLCGVFYSCSDDVFTVSVPYEGSDANAVLTAEVGSLDFSIGDDPTVTPNGVIQFTVGSSVWGFSLGTTCSTQRYGRRPTGGCATYSCLWGGQLGPSCENNELTIRLDPFGAGIGTQGYSIAPSDGMGTVTPTTATYGAPTSFTATGYTVGAGNMASFTITDIENNCSVDVPVLDACEGNGGGGATCTDGVMNGDETGVDCGGATCPACPTASCTDGVMNGDETGVDCGGATCPACPTASCTDGVMNGDETGVDCGGATCPACPTASCTDGVMNGDETGVDCGGSCDACNDGEAIPTMSEWGLILLTLMLLTFSTLYISEQQKAFSQLGQKGATQFNFSNRIPAFPLVKKVFTKTLIWAAIAALAIFVMSIALTGTITFADFFGTIICMPVLAYLLHLWIIVDKK